jgi:hypothetical protein
MPIDEHIQYVPEPAEVDARIVVWAAISALVLLFGAIGGLYAVYDYEIPIKTVPAPKVFPQPRVVTHQADIAELHQLVDAQSQRLKSWGWADDQHTLVQVPIDRAMTLLVQKGADAYAPLLPPQGALTSPTAGAQNATTPSAPANSGKPAPERRP